MTPVIVVLKLDAYTTTGDYTNSVCYVNVMLLTVINLPVTASRVSVLTAVVGRCRDSRAWRRVAVWPRRDVMYLENPDARTNVGQDAQRTLHVVRPGPYPKSQGVLSGSRSRLARRPAGWHTGPGQRRPGNEVQADGGMKYALMYR